LSAAERAPADATLVRRPSVRARALRRPQRAVCWVGLGSGRRTHGAACLQRATWERACHARALHTEGAAAAQPTAALLHTHNRPCHPLGSRQDHHCQGIHTNTHAHTHAHAHAHTQILPPALPLPGPPLPGHSHKHTHTHTQTLAHAQTLPPALPPAGPPLQEHPRARAGRWGRGGCLEAACGRMRLSGGHVWRGNLFFRTNSQKRISKLGCTQEELGNALGAAAQANSPPCTLLSTGDGRVSSSLGPALLCAYITSPPPPLQPDDLDRRVLQVSGHRPHLG